MILDDGLNVMPPLGFGVAPDGEGVASPASSPSKGRRDETPATAPTATAPEEALTEAAEAGPADSSEAAEAEADTDTDTATDTTTEETE